MKKGFVCLYSFIEVVVFMPFFLRLYTFYFNNLDKKLLFAAFCCCLIFTFPTNTVHAQTTGKKLETVKKENRKVNKKARKRGKRKERKIPDKEVPQRNSAPREKVQENASRRTPKGKESTTANDPQNRPYNAETKYQGNIKIKRGNNSYEASSFPGGEKLRRQGKDTRATNFEGDIKLNRPNGSYAASTHQGDVKYKKRSADTKATRFSGNIKVKRNVNSFIASRYKGDVKIKTARNRANYFKKLSAKANLYEGRIKLGKASKEMHPSAAYKDGKAKNSLTKKEKFRKRKLWWSRKDKNAGQPKHLKEKNKKPRYDSRESEIWYY